MDPISQETQAEISSDAVATDNVTINEEQPQLVVSVPPTITISTENNDVEVISNNNEQGSVPSSPTLLVEVSSSSNTPTISTSDAMNVLVATSTGNMASIASSMTRQLTEKSIEEDSNEATCVDMETSTFVDDYSSGDEDDQNKKKKKDDPKKFNLDGINTMKGIIMEEWKKFGFAAQTKRDAEMWAQTLQFPGVPERGEVLRRLFSVFRWGGLCFRHKAIAFDKKKSDDDSDFVWKNWYDVGWPICTAISHGGRVIIQLPKKTGSDRTYDYSFWNWIITGSKTGDVAKHVTTGTSGDHCIKRGKIIFKRLSATHGIDFEENELPLMDGTRKVLIEQKTTGFSLRDTKMLRSVEYTLKHHRHWGMNIPIGGEGQTLLTGSKSYANGSNGHLYIYHMAPKTDSYGGIMLGLEGSEYGKYDMCGEYHGVSAKSSAFSPTLGFKWHSKEHLDLTTVKGPGKYDCMFVDLSYGWDFIVEKYENEWKDDMVKQTSLPNPNHPQFTEISTKLNLSPKFISSIVNLRNTERGRKWKSLVDKRLEKTSNNFKDKITISKKKTKFYNFTTTRAAISFANLYGQ
ncbi:predicted protein [Naegleria gruberi]|uniref:Predicted protein n=1 Tax=Naegleria gruberi TaxID=5762 RepID=D2V468_NAEGR|nr:uncharacterized protein NAEGRDRAFT_63615 [Naegleria gruberi]EFC48329.1 predicted protein [Naegleria gruberi]|eukprot:XP_002681073.1 predicted protein [Naegleria gruberi strain NEG-M]